MLPCVGLIQINRLPCAGLTQVNRVALTTLFPSRPPQRSRRPSCRAHAVAYLGVTREQQDNALWHTHQRILPAKHCNSFPRIEAIWNLDLYDGAGKDKRGCSSCTKRSYESGAHMHGGGPSPSGSSFFHSYGFAAVSKDQTSLRGLFPAEPSIDTGLSFAGKSDAILP